MSETSNIAAGATVAIQNVLLPILVAVVTYLLVDRLGEWRKRKMFSTLGVAVVDSLLEEVRTGITTMNNCLAVINDPVASGPLLGRLPSASWEGPGSIPDEVLLRVLEASRGRRWEGFHPKDLRSHCKNYFVHMTQNYDNVLKRAQVAQAAQQDWRSELGRLLLEPSQYLQSAVGVERLLEDTRKLLEENSRRWVPR